MICCSNNSRIKMNLMQDKLGLNCVGNKLSSLACLDTETGNYVYVKGNKVVIQSPDGRSVSQFKNPRNNTQNRVRSERWKPL